jgi:hypothetical protein
MLATPSVTALSASKTGYWRARQLHDKLSASVTSPLQFTFVQTDVFVSNGDEMSLEVDCVLHYFITIISYFKIALFASSTSECAQLM